MLTKSLHPSDQDLLLLSDGELPGRRAARMRRHLAGCWSCRTRAAKIEATIREFMEDYSHAPESQFPPVDGPRALLKARLAESASNYCRKGWQGSFLSLQARSLAYLSALTLVVALGAGMLFRHAIAHRTSLSEDAGLLPNPSLTPGAVRPVAMGDICSMDHEEVVRPVSATVQQRVFNEYGLQGARFENYEVDYLITPGLGGSDDIRNLWPQPRYNTAWNSFVKDQLEDYLHRLVCDRKLRLATAQQDVARDWISAYKEYFHTNTPLDIRAELLGNLGPNTEIPQVRGPAQ
jgi:hypothetical protein